MRKKILLMILVLIMSNNSWSEEIEDKAYDLERIVVTATKTESSQAEIGSSTVIITGSDIKKGGKATVSEVLRNVPGIAVKQTASFGGATSLFIRGSKPGHVLVMIDGVEVNDPMSADRSFDFAHLTTDNIERIEVVRGPQSTLYGSDAMAGVVNIITKKGKGKPKISVSTEAGSHNTLKESVDINGGDKKVNYSFSLSRLDSEGISKAADTAEKDGYENVTFSSRLGYNIFNDSQMNFILRYTYAETDIDDAAFDDDPNYTIWNKNLTSRFEFSQPLKTWWDHKLSFSYSDTRRKYLDEKDSESPTEDTQSWFKGDNKKIEWQHNFSFSHWNILTAGFEYEEERGSSFNRSRTSITKVDRENVDNRGYYLQNQLQLWDGLFITPGLRLDDHPLFDTEITYKISSAYFLKSIGTRLKANWGTAFKSPSLFQLYSPIYGDPNLKPDKSKSYDLGFEQNLINNKLSFGITYFNNIFKNMVDYDFTTNKYKNIDNIKTEGIETEITFRQMEALAITAQHTYLDTEDKDTGNKLRRRPQHQSGININWTYIEKGNLNLQITNVGRSWDNDANTQKIKSYTKIDLSTFFDLTDKFRIFGRIENLFDKKYQEIRGYATAGRSFYVGIKGEF